MPLSLARHCAVRVSSGSKGKMGVGVALTTAAFVAVATPAAQASTYTVKAGDTVSNIAQRTGSTINAIIQANGLNAKAFILAGQQLTIPTTGSTTAPATSSSAPSAAVSSYTVKAGDSVWAIAQRTGSSVAAITNANGLNAQALIRVGQRLTIPTAGAASATASATVATTLTPAPAVTTSTMPGRSVTQQKVVTIASSMGVPTALAQAIAYQESGFNPGVVSPVGAIGTMQVMPANASWASSLVGRPLNLNNVDDNITAGVAILRWLLHNAPTQSAAIAGYYQGLPSVLSRGMYSDTRLYVANVLTLESKFA